MNLDTHQVSDELTNITAKANDKVTEIIKQISAKASDLVAGVSCKADDLVNTTGEKLSESGTAPAEGPVGGALGLAADKLESGGKYLADRNVKDIAGDVASLLRAHPIPSICFGMLLGGLLATAFVRAREGHGRKQNG